MSTLGHLWRRLVQLGVALELLWLVGANWTLNSAWGRSLVPEGPVAVTWAAGVTPVPGALLLWGLDVQSAAVELRVDEVFGVWWMPALLQREVRLPLGRARGVEVVVHPRPPPTTVPEPTGWRVVLPGARIGQIRTIGVDDVHMTGGQATVRGDVSIELAGEVRVDELVATWSGGTLASGGEALVEEVEASAGGHVHVVPGGTPSVVGTLSLSGRAASLAPLGKLLVQDHIEALGGSGALQAELVVDAAGLGEGSTLHVQADALHLSTLGYDAVGSGTVAASVGDGLHTEVRFGPFEVHRELDGPLQVRGEGLTLTATSPDVDPFDGITGVEVALVLPPVEMPDVSALEVYLPADAMSLASGEVTVAGQLTAQEQVGSVQGTVQLRGKGLRGALSHLGLATDLDIDLDITGGDLSRRRLEVGRSTLTLSRTTLTEGERSWDWGAQVTLLGGEVTLSSPPAASGTVEVALPDASGVLAVVAQLETWLGHIEHLLEVRDITARARLGLVQQRLHVRQLELEARGLRGAAELDLGPDPQALAWLEAGIIGVGVERTDTVQHWQLIGARHWYLQQVGAFWRR